MYETHFGFRELPFCLTPDTDFYLDSRGHAEASLVLDVCIRGGEGFIKIAGEVGTGKTMLCRRLLSRLPSNFKTIYVPNPFLSPEGLFHAIAHELGIRTAAVNPHVVMKLIEEELIQLAVLGHKAILVVDEAQSMPVETLEALRLVTNLETEKFKLLQVVLFGQPELDAILEQPALRQLRQRITFAYRLTPLLPEDVRDYINHRLARAGYVGHQLFEDKAIKLIAQASRGIPRLVNILAHKALVNAYGKGVIRVNKALVLTAIDDTESVSRPRLSLFSFGNSA